ncbi:MAG: hypothetical protein HYR63_24635 [Proteobacteria bacterium]|nr:hypothetical protein [Pseudomonadota bacterium]
MPSTNGPRIIFADGISKISVVNNVVRLDLVEVEPVAAGTNQERPVARLLLPLNMLQGLITDLSRISSQSGMTQPGVMPQAAPAAPAQGGGTMIPPPPLGPPPRWNPKA